MRHAQEARVTALKRLWERAEPSADRLFRHSSYAHIAACEPEAWALCGSVEDRAKDIKNPSDLPQGSRPAAVIVRSWDAAFYQAFGGLMFTHVRGSKDPRGPAGYWTTELKSTA